VGGAATVFKSILIGIDASEQSKYAQALGFHLAHRLQARVLGLHVINVLALEPPLPDDISESGDFEPYLDSLPTREQLAQGGRQLLAEFAELAGREGVNAETLLEFGLVGDCLVQHSRSADLTLMGRGGSHHTPELGQAADTVVRNSSNTVLLCPGPVSQLRHLVLAYDGSERAAKAMHSAAALASALAARISVVSVARDAKAAERYLDEAREYLGTYGLQTDYHALTGAPGQHIVEFADQAQADGIFLGAHGHSRVVEMVLGSTTEYVLRHSRRALLLCH
jgi:nucleotide-binding universal stress UspA family protein